jgi:hypothetical protein
MSWVRLLPGQMRQPELPPRSFGCIYPYTANLRPFSWHVVTRSGDSPVSVLSHSESRNARPQPDSHQPLLKQPTE